MEWVTSDEYFPDNEDQHGQKATQERLNRENPIIHARGSGHSVSVPISTEAVTALAPPSAKGSIGERAAVPRPYVSGGLRSSVQMPSQLRRELEFSLQSDDESDDDHFSPLTHYPNVPGAKKSSRFAGNLSASHRPQTYNWDMVTALVDLVLEDLCSMLDANTSGTSQMRRVAVLEHLFPLFAILLAESSSSNVMSAAAKLFRGEWVEILEWIRLRLDTNSHNERAGWSFSRTTILSAQWKSRKGRAEIADEENVGSHFRFIVGGEEYRWLLRRCEVADKFSPITTDHMDMKVCYELLDVVLGARLRLMSRWDPSAFLREQYPNEPQAKLDSVICLCGDYERPQAIACKEYIGQMWPEHGSELLAILSNNSTNSRRSAGSVVDLKVRIENAHTYLDAKGPPVALLEVAEAFVWLGAACSTSAGEEMDYRSPSIRKIRGAPPPLKTWIDRRFTREIDGSNSSPYEVTYSHQPIGAIKAKQNPQASDAACWLNLFSNSTIARGYPTSPRESNEDGLEIPIEMAAELGRAQYATTFDGFFLLKGFCSALVPVDRTATSIVWHYLLSENNARLTYNETLPYSGMKAPDDIIYDSLIQTRHFVGWTPKPKNLIGTKHASYDSIEYTGKNFARSGFALSGVTLNGGKQLSPGVTITAGLKDQSLFFRHADTYELVLEDASLTNVVLYDIHDERGWLMDGASALLHMSRTWLSHPDAPPAMRGFSQRLVNEFLHLDGNEKGRKTAYDVLINDHNREMAMFPSSRRGVSGSGQTSYKFEDLVLRLWHTIEQIKDHQVKIKNSTLHHLENPLHKTIEGFGFLDIVLGDIPLHPRYKAMDNSCGRWLKATDCAGAINILGSSFGDLVEARSSTCKLGWRVPTGANLLCAPVKRIEEIAKRNGEIHNTHVEIVQGVFWYEPEAFLQSLSCSCFGSGSHQGKCEIPVVELEGKRRGKAKNPVKVNRNILQSHRDAAVLIGSKKAVRKAIEPLSPESDDSTSIQHDPQLSDSGIEMDSPEIQIETTSTQEDQMQNSIRGEKQIPVQESVPTREPRSLIRRFSSVLSNIAHSQ